MSRVDWIRNEIRDARKLRATKMKSFWKINGLTLIDLLKNGGSKVERSMAQVELNEFIKVLENEIEIIRDIKKQIDGRKK